VHPRNADQGQGCVGNAGGGASQEQILEDFPDLEPEDIRVCLQYAAAQANHAVLQAA